MSPSPCQAPLAPVRATPRPRGIRLRPEPPRRRWRLGRRPLAAALFGLVVGLQLALHALGLGALDVLLLATAAAAAHTRRTPVGLAVTAGIGRGLLAGAPIGPSCVLVLLTAWLIARIAGVLSPEAWLVRLVLLGLALCAMELGWCAILLAPPDCRLDAGFAMQLWLGLTLYPVFAALALAADRR